MIRSVIIAAFCLSSVYGYEHKSDITIYQINYSDLNNETVLSGKTELKFDNDIFTTKVNLEYLYSSQYDERRYLYINELYITKEYEEYRFSLGKIIQYWGELEGFNIADVFNQKNYLLDPFDKSAKLGSWAFLASKYFDENVLEFGIKFYEEDQKYPDHLSPYYPFGSMNYDDDLILSDSRYKPTFHLSYSFSTDELLESETKLIFQHGYDNKRYFIPIDQRTLAQYAYRMNRYLLLSHVVYEDTIFKMEASYTDVISDDMISDYAQLSFGVEKSFYDLAGTDLNLYAEYYRYIYFDDDKIENVDISEIYNDDVFLALKLNFNNVGSTEFKGGILYDFGNKEKVFKIEAKSRIKDSFIISAELLRLLPQDNTILSEFDDDTRVMLGLSYTF